MISKNILVISHDRVGPSMAGPGIRYHKIATHLSKQHNVTLAVFNPHYIENLKDVSYKPIDINIHNFKNEFSKYDCIIALWLSDEMIEFAKSQGIVIIFDLYAPVPVEDLVQRVFGKNVNSQSDYDYGQMIQNYGHFIRNGDFILTSNEQQRDFWIGYAFANHKICPSSQSHRSIDTYFGICPMGIDLSEIKHKDRLDLLCKRVKTIKKDDFIIVWTGGIWDWFDAQTPIKALSRLVNGGEKNIKLIFLGTKHPNDDVPAMAETEKARNLANKLGLINKNVFFLDGWLPYNDRISYLARADLAIYAHKPSVESRFSHRTRVLDHILMALPTIATCGDYFSDFINKYELGISVQPFDDKSMAEAIISLNKNKKLVKKIKENIINIRFKFTWDCTLKELDEFINSDNFKPSRYEKHAISNRRDIVTSSQLATKLKRFIPKRIKNIIKHII